MKTQKFMDVPSRICLVGIFLLFTGALFAQQQIEGQVVDEEGMGLIGANVLIKGTSTGTQTDFEGNFTIQAQSGDVLVVSYIGYQTREVEVGAESAITITLQQNPSVLDELVVTGYSLSLVHIFICIIS